MTFPMALALLAAGFFAGLVDTIAGGGGLLTLPALLLSGVPPLEALATNKAQSVAGSTMGLWRFSRTRLLDRTTVLRGFGFGFLGSLLGATLVSQIPNTALRPVVLVLLVSAAVLTLLARPRAEGLPRRRPNSWTTLVALAIGAYDGFFGPGTGTLLILAFVLVWHQAYDAASANAKTVNCGSNWGALTTFALLGATIHWPRALLMALGQVAGAWLGAHLVVKRGQNLVRWISIGVSLCLAARLAWEVLTA